MSDDESPRNSAGDDEVALPKATVHKLVQGQPSPVLSCLALGETVYLTVVTHTEFLPAGFTATKEVKDLMVDCCKGPYPRPSPSLKPSHWLTPCARYIPQNSS